MDSCTVYTEKTASNVKNALLLLPNGIISWSMGVKGLVQTSTNLGVMEEEDGKLVIGSLVRSSVESQKSIVKSQIESSCRCTWRKEHLLKRLSGLGV